MLRSNIFAFYRRIFLAILVISLCFTVSACRGDESADISTDVDSEKILSDMILDGVQDGNYVLNIGDFRIIAFRLTDAEKGKTASVTSSNPMAVSAEIVQTIPECVFVRLSAIDAGNATVTVEILSEDGSVVRSDSVSVSVPKQEIFAASFGISDGEITLSIGESLVDKVTVYALGKLSEGDIDLRSSDGDVVSVDLSEVYYGDFFTVLPYKAVAKSVGTARLTATLSDGRTTFVDVTVTEDVKASEETRVEVVEVPNVSQNDSVKESESAELTYVLNVKSKKFHYPSCRGVKDMKEENKGSFYGSRDAVIAEGYSPCGTCKP